MSDQNNHDHDNATEILESIVAAMLAGLVLGSTIAAIHFLQGG